MIVLGLTGSIGMGKSTASAMLRRLGCPVHDADACVHKLLGQGGKAVPEIDAAFSGVVVNGAVDRAALGAKVFGDAEALRLCILSLVLAGAALLASEAIARRMNPLELRA